MRIAQIAPLYEAVPPRAYGGTERVIAGLCDELTARGHDVTLYAAGESQTAATLEAVVPSPLRVRMTRQELAEVAPHLHLRMLAEIYARAGDFDVIHAHTDIWTLPYVETTRTPTLLTLHGRLDLESVRQVFPLYPDVPLVSISDFQRAAVADLPMRWVGTAYNGLDLSAYLDSPTRDDGYLAFVGRITPEKRPDWAVEVARRAGLPLKVAAKVDPLDIDYWEETIRPLFEANDVEFIGEILETEKPAFFANASAVLFPIDWPEPFGLVMIEAMAAGTPVVALKRGSVPEVLTDGVSGFICESLEEMVAAVGRVETIDAATCRAEAQRFTASAMADRYLRIYERLLIKDAALPMTGSPAGDGPRPGRSDVRRRKQPAARTHGS